MATDEARARVRAAESDDEAGVRSVLTQLFRSDHERFRHLDVRQGSRSFVAERNGEVVGFALAAWIDYGLPTETSGTIELLVVDERHRGRGLGRELRDVCGLARIGGHRDRLRLDSGGIGSRRVLRTLRLPALRGAMARSSFFTRRVTAWSA